MKRRVLLLSLAIYILIVCIQISIIHSTRLGVKHVRNSYQNCETEHQCAECIEDDNYKMCKLNLCYCCNLDSQCRTQK
jgi:hypothetical protein